MSSVSEVNVAERPPLTVARDGTRPRAGWRSCRGWWPSWGRRLEAGAQQPLVQVSVDPLEATAGGAVEEPRVGAGSQRRDLHLGRWQLSVAVTHWSAARVCREDKAG